MSIINTKAKLHHVTIQTSNFERAFRFYTELLGLKIIKEPFNFKGKRTLAWLDAGSVELELYSLKKGMEPEPFSDRRLGVEHIAFEVEDLDLALEKLKMNEIVVIKEPFKPQVDDEPNVPRMAVIEGPDGEEIALRELSSHPT